MEQEDFLRGIELGNGFQVVRFVVDKGDKAITGSLKMFDPRHFGGRYITFIIKAHVKQIIRKVDLVFQAQLVEGAQGFAPDSLRAAGQEVGRPHQ